MNYKKALATIQNRRPAATRIETKRKQYLFKNDEKGNRRAGRLQDWLDLWRVPYQTYAIY